MIDPKLVRHVHGFVGRFYILHTVLGYVESCLLLFGILVYMSITSHPLFMPLIYTDVSWRERETRLEKLKLRK